MIGDEQSRNQEERRNSGKGGEGKNPGTPTRESQKAHLVLFLEVEEKAYFLKVFL